VDGAMILRGLILRLRCAALRMTVRFFEDGLARCARGPSPGGRRLPTEEGTAAWKGLVPSWRLPAEGTTTADGEWVRLAGIPVG